MAKLGKFTFVLQFVIYFALLYVLQFASVGGHFEPFAIGLMVALIWANQKVWLVCPAFILSCIAYNFSFEYALIGLCATLAIALPYYLHVMRKKVIKSYELIIYTVLALTATIIFQALGTTNVFVILANIAVCVFFMLACKKIFEPIIIRGFMYKLTSLELICGAAIILALSDGLVGCSIYGFSLLKMFACFILLALSYTIRSREACLIASIMGLGTMLSNNNPVYIAPFIVWSLAITAFKSKNRLFPFFAIIASDLILGFYFKAYLQYGILQIAPVLAGAAIFLILPSKLYESIGVLLACNNDRLATKNLMNRNQEYLKRKISNLSEVFCEMDSVFKRLIKKNMNEDEVKEMLCEEIRASVCAACPEKAHCHRTFAADTKKTFMQLITVAMERGKVTLLDLPSYLSSRCGKAQALLGEVNTLTSQYKNYSNLVGDVDTSKLLISDQLSGMSGVMKSLARDVGMAVAYDSTRENHIIDELAYNNIICTDAALYEKDTQTFMVTLVVRSDDSNRVKLPEIVSKVCGNKMSVYEVYPSSRTGLTTVNLKTAPRYDCVFGIASHNKGGSSISGDTHSIVRLDGDKFMFALCDGMGSGERAGEKSETTISLIENFYKAGFDNDIILSSVNKLLNLERDEVFSTIDLCVIDLKNGIADFVKMGSPCSYVRGEDSCSVVDGGALPLGVLHDVSALSQKLVLKEKDFIILCSDGISDSFGTDNEFKDFIMGVCTANPQEFADTILSRALAGNNGYAVDDMTCLVVKIFEC